MTFVFSNVGINKAVRYSIQKDVYNSSEFFYIDAEDGSVYLKRSLDHETRPYHHFIVVANDTGIPSLSTTAHVWVNGKSRIVSLIFVSPRFFSDAKYRISIFRH